MNLEYQLTRWTQWLLRRLSYRAGSELGSWAGRLFELAGIRRAVVLDNLRGSNLGDWDDATIIRCYQNFGRTFFELLNGDRFDANVHAALHLPANFSHNVRAGAFLLSAHLGNWELMGKVLASRVRLAVVAEPLKNDAVNNLIADQRRKQGLRVVSAGDVWQIRELLSKGWCLAMLVDQNLFRGGYRVQFLGRRCLAPSGPFRLIKAFSKPVYLSYALRKDSHHHTFICRDLTFAPDDDADQMAKKTYAELEKVIRQNPDQWFWHHRRWKVPP